MTATNSKHSTWPKVSIIILNYKEKDLTIECINSFSKLVYPNFEIIIIDNNSQDGSEEVLREQFPGIFFIQTGKNLGYAGGNNVGINHALQNNASYVLIVNPDTVVINPNFLTMLVEYMESHINVGVTGPKVYWRSKDIVQNTVLIDPGFFRNIEAWFKVRFRRRNSMRSGDDITEAEVLNGVCILIRSKMLKEVGLFDENMFGYKEDVDLNFRARKKGWRIVYVPVESIIHKEKLIGYEMTSMTTFLLKRNTVYFLKKAGRHFDAYGYAASSLGLMLLRAVLAPARRENPVEYFKMVWRLLVAYWVILANRQFTKRFGLPYTD